MDELDQKLLHLLSQDARRPAAALARELGVSRSTIQNRIDRLLADRIVRRFTVEYFEPTQAASVSAIVMVKADRGDSRQTLAKLARIPEVEEVTSVNGAFDYALEVTTPSLQHLDEVLSQIRRLPKILETDSCIRLQRFK